MSFQTEKPVSLKILEVLYGKSNRIKEENEEAEESLLRWEKMGQKKRWKPI